jgi:hypothetical protein
MPALTIALKIELLRLDSSSRVRSNSLFVALSVRSGPDHERSRRQTAKRVEARIVCTLQCLRYSELETGDEQQQWDNLFVQDARMLATVAA